MPKITWLAGAVLALTALGSCQIPTRQKPDRQRGAEAADVVVLTLHGRLSETGAEGQPFGGEAASLRKLLRRLRAAQESPKVKKIVLRIGGLETGRAQLAELRNAVRLTRKAGKQVIAHLDDAGNGEYFLATAADEIVMSDAGTLWFVGVAAQVTFLKGLLDKIGVQAELLHEGKYKGAAEPLTRDRMSDETREAMGALLDDSFAELVTAVSEARKLPEAEVRALVDRAPLTAQAALGARLVDRVANHRQDTQRLAAKGSINWIYGQKKKETGTLRSLMELLKPSELTKPPKEPHVALVYAEGPIIHGPRRKGIGATAHVASYPLVATLEELRESDRAKAVVLRIDSPGGSALASEVIYQAVLRLAKAKPVVVSMGDVAASGGYYIAAPASRILAQPGSITGSIGVVGGKFSVAGLFGKVGLATEVLTRGARADLFNLARPWTPEERTVVQAHMAHTYRLFVARVAEGRKLSPAEVEKVAQGRIWSGRAAQKLKLVDKLGGLLDAAAEAKQLAKLPSAAKIAVYPRPMTWIERLQEGLGATETGVMATLGQVSRLEPSLGPLQSLLFVLPAWQREHVLAWLPVLFTVR